MEAAGPLALEKLASVFSAQVSGVTERFPSLRRYQKKHPGMGTWDPHEVIEDALHAKARHLGPADTSMGGALALEDLDEGSDSPPQVGGGPIDELAAYGYSVHKFLSFTPMGSPAVEHDRNLTPSALDPQQLVVSSLGPAHGTTPAPDVVVLRPACDTDSADSSVSSIFSIGATEHRSVAALQRLPDFEEWKPAVRAEIGHAIDKNAITVRPHSAFQAARKRFAGRHEVLNLVTPCVIKHDADGKVLRRKFRITAADVRGNPNSTCVTETYSGAVDGSTIRFIANATLGRPLKGTRRGLDVKGAYFEGRKLPPEEGGRSLWAPIPQGWVEFGCPAFGADGSRNWFEITGNVPGLRDAGRIWAADCDAFLAGEGFVQSIVDRRVFIKQLGARAGDKIFVIGVYVDDYWTYCEDDAAWEDFYGKWSTRYTASSTVSEAGNDFCGTTFTELADGSLSLTCGKLMTSMATLLEAYPTSTLYDTPMAADALTRIRDNPSDTNKLLPEKVSEARAILGLGLYITRGVRTDSLFPALALSSYIVNKLTVSVWTALLRWAHYLVQTRTMALILRAPPRTDPNFAACSDSSLINGPMSSVTMPDVAVASYGGFALFFPGSGAFSVECFSPRRLADSSAGSELIMATWAGKSIVAFRVLGRELGILIPKPTDLQLNASAVTDGVAMERVSRVQRFLAARLGMMRSWVADSTLRILKSNTNDMRADILSKPVNPSALFGPKQRLLLTGHS